MIKPDKTLTKQTTPAVHFTPEHTATSAFHTHTGMERGRPKRKRRAIPSPWQPLPTIRHATHPMTCPARGVLARVITGSGNLGRTFQQPDWRHDGDVTSNNPPRKSASMEKSHIPNTSTPASEGGGVIMLASLSPPHGMLSRCLVTRGNYLLTWYWGEGGILTLIVPRFITGPGGWNGFVSSRMSSSTNNISNGLRGRDDLGVGGERWWGIRDNGGGW